MCNRVNGGAPGTASPSGHARIGVSIVAMACLWLSTDARAETIGGALSKAYLNNPNLNSQRAAVRSVDESLPKAQAAKLPTIAGQAQAGLSAEQIGVPAAGNTSTSSLPRNYGLTVTQILYD